jgi:hypothetical protein
MARARPSPGGRVIVVTKKTRLPGLVAIADCGRSHRAIGVPPGGGGVQVRVIYEGGPGEAGIIFKTPGHYVGP